MDNSYKSSDDGGDSDSEAETDSQLSVDSETNSPVEVPIQALDDVILLRIVEEFVLREGTDYGAEEVSLENKTAQVLKQLEKGDVKIFFDPETESINLVKVRQGL